VDRVGQSVLSLPRNRPSAVLRVLPSGRALLIGIAALAIGSGLYGLARETSMFSVRAIEVEGAPPAVAVQVRAALQSFRGTSLLRLQGAAVVRRVESLPTVVSASYDRDFPHTLRVRVVAEQPVAVLRRGVSSWLVSARGRVMGAVDPKRHPRLSRIWLVATTQIETGALLDDEDGGAAARALASFAGSGVATRVVWARAHSGTLTVGLRSGLEVRFGPTADLPLKLAIVKAILPAFAAPSAGGPTYLDVAVPERPVAGKNSQPGG
jgi:cell division protein FtsQ